MIVLGGATASSWVASTLLEDAFGRLTTVATNGASVLAIGHFHQSCWTPLAGKISRHDGSGHDVVEQNVGQRDEVLFCQKSLDSTLGQVAKSVISGSKDRVFTLG